MLGSLSGPVMKLSCTEFSIRFAPPPLSMQCLNAASGGIKGQFFDL